MIKVLQNCTKEVFDNFLDHIDNLMRRGDLSNALEELTCFIDESKNENEDFNFRAILSRGVVYRKLGDYKTALAEIKKALDLAKSLDKINGIASCYNSIGIIYKNQGKYDQALDNYFKALGLRQSVGDLKNTANVQNNIGVIYNYLGLSDKSETFFLKSLKTRLRSGEKSDIAASYNNLGAFYYGRKDSIKALDYYTKSLEIKEEVNDIAGIGITTNNIGLIYKSNGDIDKAIEFHQKSLKIREKIKDIKGMVVSRINLANDYLDKGDYQQCEQLINLALKETMDLDSDQLLVKCYSTLTELKENQKDFQKSLFYNKKFYQLQNSILSQETHNKINMLQANHEAEMQRFRNEKLGKLIKKIRAKNQELRKHKSFLRFINKILRHDVKNKLASSISSYRLFNQTKEDSFLVSGTEAIKASLKIIDRMKELESMISDNPQMCIYNLYDTITHVLNTLPQMKADISQLDKRFDILADSALPSIFDNLIGNILKHSGVKECRISSKRRNQWIEIKIEDQGKGIPKNLENEIFNEGFTFGENSNTGMGLYIVKTNIERYGGFIFCEANKPAGTIFIINLKALN